jgi:predicted SnoaL-like aldol condensation-catalyzing enzyme
VRQVISERIVIIDQDDRRPGAGSAPEVPARLSSRDHFGADSTGLKPQVVWVHRALRTPQTAVMDTIEQNKNTVTKFIDALFTKGDLGAVDEYLAEEFVNHDPPLGVTADREGMRTAGAMFRAAFPDWHSEMDIMVGEGDLIVEHATGRHRNAVAQPGVRHAGQQKLIRLMIRLLTPGNIP